MWSSTLVLLCEELSNVERLCSVSVDAGLLGNRAPHY